MENRILLVDDDALLRERLAKAFRRRDFVVFTAGDFDEAIKAIEKHRPAMAVIDLKMPGKSGLELIQAAKKIEPAMLLLVLTGYGSIATATEAVKLGALAYLPKPADADDILTAFSKEADLGLDLEQGDFPAPSLARAEWEHINRVLADCDGNISLAAVKLGLHRRSLQRKLQKYPPAK